MHSRGADASRSYADMALNARRLSFQEPPLRNNKAGSGPNSPQGPANRNTGRDTISAPLESIDDDSTSAMAQGPIRSTSFDPQKLSEPFSRFMSPSSQGAGSDCGSPNELSLPKEGSADSEGTRREVALFCDAAVSPIGVTPSSNFMDSPADKVQSRNDTTPSNSGTAQSNLKKTPTPLQRKLRNSYASSERPRRPASSYPEQGSTKAKDDSLIQIKVLEKDMDDLRQRNEFLEWRLRDAESCNAKTRQELASLQSTLSEKEAELDVIIDRLKVREEAVIAQDNTLRRHIRAAAKSGLPLDVVIELTEGFVSNDDLRWTLLGLEPVNPGRRKLFLCPDIQAELELKKAYLVHLWALARKFELTYEYSILAPVIPDCVRTSRMLRIHLAHVGLGKSVSAEEGNCKDSANTAKKKTHHNDSEEALYQDKLDCLDSEDVMQACLLVAKELAVVMSENGCDKASLLVDTSQEVRQSHSPHIILREKIEELRMAYGVEKALRSLADIQGEESIHVEMSTRRKPFVAFGFSLNTDTRLENVTSAVSPSSQKADEYYLSAADGPAKLTIGELSELEELDTKIKQAKIAFYWAWAYHCNVEPIQAATKHEYWKAKAFATAMRKVKDVVETDRELDYLRKSNVPQQCGSYVD